MGSELVVSSVNHERVRQWANLEWGRTDKVSIDLIKMYNQLMDARNVADYRADKEFSYDEAKDMQVKATAFNKEK